MNTTSKELLKITRWYFYTAIVVFYITLTFFINYFFYTKIVFYNTFSDQLAYESISKIFNSQNRYKWLAYLFAPIIILIRILYNSFWVTTCSLLNNNQSDFIRIFNICLKAEYIFIIMLITKFASFVFFKEVNTLNDLGFISGSLANIFNMNDISKWKVYPLQTINIWEILFCWVGAELYAIEFSVPRSKAFQLFCVPYLIGLFIWVLVVVFLTLQFT